MRKTVFVLTLFMTGEFLSLPFAPLFALPLVPLMKPLTASRTGERILAVLFIPAAVVTAGAASYRLASFVGDTSLPGTPVWLIAAITVSAALYLASGRPEGLQKFAGFALPLTVIFIMIAALLLAGKLQINGFAVPRLWERNPLLAACEGIALLGLMPALRYKEKPFRAYLAALAAACVLGAAVWSLGNFTLGAGLYEKVQYPFYTALRVAKGGELIGRIEAFLAPVLLCAAVLKTAACIIIITRSVKAYMPASSTAASNVRFPETAPET